MYGCCGRQAAVNQWSRVFVWYGEKCGERLKRALERAHTGTYGLAELEDGLAREHGPVGLLMVRTARSVRAAVVVRGVYRWHVADTLCAFYTACLSCSIKSAAYELCQEPGAPLRPPKEHALLVVTPDRVTQSGPRAIVETRNFLRKSTRWCGTLRNGEVLARRVGLRDGQAVFFLREKPCRCLYKGYLFSIATRALEYGVTVAAAGYALHELHDCGMEYLKSYEALVSTLVDRGMVLEERRVATLVRLAAQCVAQRSRSLAHANAAALSSQVKSEIAGAEFYRGPPQNGTEACDVQTEVPQHESLPTPKKRKQKKRR